MIFLQKANTDQISACVLSIRVHFAANLHWIGFLFLSFDTIDDQMKLRQLTNG